VSEGSGRKTSGQDAVDDHPEVIARADGSHEEQGIEGGEHDEEEVHLVTFLNSANEEGVEGAYTNHEHPPLQRETITKQSQNDTHEECLSESCWR